MSTTRLCRHCNGPHGRLYYSPWLGNLLCEGCLWYYVGLTGRELFDYLSNPARNTAGWELKEAAAIPYEITPQDPKLRRLQEKGRFKQLPLFDKAN